MPSYWDSPYHRAELPPEPPATPLTPDEARIAARLAELNADAARQAEDRRRQEAADAARFLAERQEAALQDPARAAFLAAGGTPQEFAAHWPAIRAALLQQAAVAGVQSADDPRQAQRRISGQW
jgi:hypothetical protein